MRCGVRLQDDMNLQVAWLAASMTEHEQCKVRHIVCMAYKQYSHKSHAAQWRDVLQQAWTGAGLTKAMALMYAAVAPCHA